jgi:hypothetical protein
VPIKGYTSERCAIKIYRAWIKIKFTFYDIPLSLSKAHSRRWRFVHEKVDNNNEGLCAWRYYFFASWKANAAAPRLGSRAAENATPWT